MRSSFLLASLIFALPLSSARADGNVPRRAERVVFPFDDARYLRGGQENGGMVFVPPLDGEDADDALPLVVFLHGVNPSSALHPWLGGAVTTDLTKLASAMIDAGRTRPFLLAAPTESRDAMAGRRMWQSFDLDAFVDAVDASLAGKANVARDRVIVLGHSGAGCNPDGGLLKIATHPGAIVPAALVAIDTCLDEESGDALGSAPAGTQVFVRWQRALWSRPVDRFVDAFDAAAHASGRAELDMREGLASGGNPHEEIVPESLTELLPALLEPDWSSP